jgi:hypothetical protein
MGVGARGADGQKGIKGECGARGPPGRGLQGPPGPPGTPGRMDSKSISTICRKSAKPTKINFFAGLSTNYRGANSAIKYDTTMANDGNGYSASTGCFVAPVDGVYFIQTNALRCQNSGQLYIHIMHNSEIVSSTSNLDETFESVSASVVLNLAKGDVVWVKLRIGQVYGHSPSHYTNFMGYCVTDESKSRSGRDAIPLSQEEIDARAEKFIAEHVSKEQTLLGDLSNEPGMTESAADDYMVKYQDEILEAFKKDMPAE